MTTLDDITDSLAFLDTWEERYRFIIDLGRALAPMDDDLKTEGTQVDGCMSQVWILGRPDPDDPQRLRLVADSDALIVRGLIGVLMAAYDGRTAAEVQATDIEALFAELGLESHLSVNRRNGFYAMVGRIRQLAELALAK